MESRRVSSVHCVCVTICSEDRGENEAPMLISKKQKRKEEREASMEQHAYTTTSSSSWRGRRGAATPYRVSPCELPNHQLLPLLHIHHPIQKGGSLLAPKRSHSSLSLSGLFYLLVSLVSTQSQCTQEMLGEKGK